MRALLDTSVLIGSEPPPDVEAAISVASLAELHFGVLVAGDDDERALRTQRLGAIESTFEALSITAEIAREWGRLAAAVLNRGGQPSLVDVRWISRSPPPPTRIAFRC
jgi:predicted nucleic acid-binding protein